MPNYFETGHAKNVANFEDLISFCIGYGATYNPSNVNIKIPALQTKLTASQAALQLVKVTKTAYDNSTNGREVAFLNLKKLCTRVVNSLETTTATVQTVDDAKTVNRKIQGKRADNTTPPVETNPTPNPLIVQPPVPKQISVSQQSYDSLIDNFAKLIQVVSTEPTYLPNEIELKVTTLNALLTSLKTSNTSVINTYTIYSNSLTARNTVLYADITGLVYLAGEVKKYVKSVYGATSPQYSQVSGIQFTTPR